MPYGRGLEEQQAGARESKPPRRTPLPVSIRRALRKEQAAREKLRQGGITDEEALKNHQTESAQ